MQGKGRLQQQSVYVCVCVCAIFGEGHLRVMKGEGGVGDTKGEQGRAKRKMAACVGYLQGSQAGWELRGLGWRDGR